MHGMQLVFALKSRVSRLFRIVSLLALVIPAVLINEVQAQVQAQKKSEVHRAESLRVEQKDPQFHLKEGVLYYSQKKFTGVQFEKFLNGALYRESEFKEGLKTGVEKKYSLEGKLRSQWLFLNGQKDGEQKGWFEDGARLFVYHYSKGVLQGEQIEWHQNGNLFRRQVFENGIETDRKILYQGGEVFTNFAKREGRTYGIDGGALCFDKKKDGEK